MLKVFFHFVRFNRTDLREQSYRGGPKAQQYTIGRDGTVMTGYWARCRRMGPVASKTGGIKQMGAGKMALTARESSNACRVLWQFDPLASLLTKA
jgi:hypothetical protein